MPRAVRATAAVVLGVVALALCCGADPTVRNMSMIMPDVLSSINLVTWRVEHAAVRTEPVLFPAHDWDEEIGGKGTILVDPIDGLYKVRAGAGTVCAHP